MKTALLLIALIAGKASAGPVVVELFTSEGCSSCPPADALLADLAKRPGVIALEFHVDYWNHLGWRDPYSSAAYSERQRRYGEDVYTPMMVVNGTNAFVGSNRLRAEAAIAAGLSEKSQTSLSGELNGRRLEYRASGVGGNDRLCVAVVDASTTSSVRRGENAGKILRHVRVVRGFLSVLLTSEGRGGIELPALAPPGGAVVFFIQRPSGAITAASEIH